MEIYQGKGSCKLLFRPPKKADECLAGYFIRIAEGNGFAHLGHLLNYAGLNWKNNRAPIHQILSGQYELAPLLNALGLPEYQSNISKIYQSFQRGIDTPYILAKYPRVCPQCLDEQGYCKFQWALLPIVVCSRHKRVLIDINPTTAKRLRWYRPHVSKFDDETSLIMENEKLAPLKLLRHSQYFESLLPGNHKGTVHRTPIVLTDLTFREALSLIHFIAHYQTRLEGSSFNLVSLHNYDLAYVYEQVWKTLETWPDNFYSLLSQYVDNPMSRKGKAGLSNHFRDLYERLHRQKENRGIARIKIEFDRYIDEYWPGILEPDRIVRINLSPVTRNIISKKEAARIMGTRLERLDRLVQQGRINPVIFKGKAHYLRNEIERLGDEISSNWAMTDACKALELTRYQLKQLLDSGVVTALQRPDSLNRDWIIDKQACHKLINSLKTNARKSEPPVRSISMDGIQRQGYSIVRLILAMQSGDVEYSSATCDDGNFSFRQFFGFEIIDPV